MLAAAMASSPLAVSAASNASSSDALDDNSQVDVPSEYRVFYWIFAVIGVVLFYYSMGYAKKYCTMAAFLLPVRDAHCSGCLFA